MQPVHSRELLLSVRWGARVKYPNVKMPLVPKSRTFLLGCPLAPRYPYWLCVVGMFHCWVVVGQVQYTCLGTHVADFIMMQCGETRLGQHITCCIFREFGTKNTCHCTIVCYFKHTTLYWSIYVLYVLPACWIILNSICFVLTALPCGTPSSLSNGQRHYTSTTVGSTVTYTCYTGYRMTAGNSSRTCLFGGRWSGSHPTCSSEFMLVTFIIFAAWLSWGYLKELTHVIRILYHRPHLVL